MLILYNFKFKKFKLFKVKRKRRWPSGLGRCDCDPESMGSHPGRGKKSRAEFVAKNMRVAVSGLALGPNILGQDVNLRIAYRNDFQGHSVQARKCAGKRSTPALKPARRVMEVRNRGYQWPHKRTSVRKKFKKKSNKRLTH